MVRTTVAIRTGMILFLFFLCSVAQAQTTVTLAPAHDAYVNDSSPTTNFNTSYLVVGRSATEFLPRYRTYLRFTFGTIPTSAIVTSAQLRLSLQATEGTGSMNVEVRRALATWTSTTIVWNTQPASSSAVTTVNVSATAGTIAVFNLVSAVQGWVNGSTINNGLVLQAANETSTGQTRTFASNNHVTTSLRPELVVTYSLPADIVVSPLSVSFGNQLLGGVSAPKTVTIQNTGGLNLTVSSIAASTGEFLVEGVPSLPAVIAPGGSTSFNARFMPVTTGIKSGSILIASNDTDEGIVTVSCTGTAVAPEIAVTPTALVFPDQLVNTTSAAQTLRIKNEGTAPLTITSLKSSTAEYSVANVPALPAAIAPGIEVSLPLRFTPTAAGKRNGTISIANSDADEGLVTVACSGTGVLPRVTIAPVELLFGSQVVGTSSQPLTATIRNESAVQVQVNSITSGDADFLLSNPPALPASIPPTGQLPFNVVYHPDSVKKDAGCINVSVRISPESVMVICVPVGGIGVGPQDDLPVIPAQMAYRWDGVAVNTLSATQGIVARNPGTVARTITDIRVVNSSDPILPFSVLNKVTLPAVIPGGGSLKLGDAQFAPTAVRTSLAAIEITTNATVNPIVRIRVEGRSIDPSTSEFYTDPRAYRVEFDKLKYGDGDNIWIRFTPASDYNPRSEATVYVVSPVQNDIERVTLRNSGTGIRDYGQVNGIITSRTASSQFDGKLSVQPGEFFFLFYQGPDALPTAGGTTADFAFLRGGAPRGFFSLASDSSLTPKTLSVPGRPGETPRGLVAVAGTGTPAGIMGDDQIIIQPRDMTELNDFLRRYGGRVVDNGTRPGAGQFVNRHFYLVRINPDSADLSDFAFTAELAGVRGNLRSSATAKTNQLFAVLANEQLESRRVALNPRLQFFDRPSTVEAANLLPGGAGSDAFQLNYVLDCVQKVNRAWMYVAMQDRDRSAGTSVRLAVIDDGFCTNPDLSMVAGEGYDIAQDDDDPTGARLTDDGLDWHGSDVASAAASLLNNGIGSAGSGGQVADLMFYRLGGTDFAFEAGTAIDLAVARSAKVINMSFGLPCRVFGGPSFADYKDIGFWLNLLILCPFIDAVMETALALVRPFLPVQPFFTCEDLMITMAIARSRMEASVEDALAAGVSLVASAGNARTDVPVPPSDIADFDIIPASFPGVIAVGEMDNTYTNTQFFGNRVDVWSVDPVRVFGPPTNANNCAAAPVVRNFNGTSSSAAFISGVVCMMRAVNPDLTPADVRGILRSLPPGPADATVQRALDAYAVVREAGTRAGLPDLALTSTSIGFDENPLANQVCGPWPAHQHTTDDTPNTANVLPIDGSDFADRGIHTFVPGGGLDLDNYVFEVPENLPEGTAFDVSINTFFPTAAGAVVPHPNATIVELGGIFEGFSRATWQAYSLFLTDNLYFSVQGVAANLAERDNVYELTSRITQHLVLADRYDRAPLGTPPNNTFADATHLPNAPGGDVYSFNDDAVARVWQMTVQNLNFHTPDDVDFFRLDLPDEAGDDCSSGIPDCIAPGVNAIFNGLLEITVRGASQIIAYDANGNVLQQDQNYLRYTCPRSGGNDIVYFEVVGSTSTSQEYSITITYSVPDPGVAQNFMDLCNAKGDPNSPDPSDSDDSYSFVSPGTREIQQFTFGAPCNPLFCDPPKHDYLVFNWKQSAVFAVGFEHSLDETFRFQLRDNKLRLMGAAHPSGFTTKVSSTQDSLLRQRIDIPSLPAGLYLLRIDSAQIGSQFAVRFETLAGVEKDKSNRQIPTSYLLEQNHPNPFNPTTTISYALPRNSLVSLSVYNTLGEVVRELVNEEQPAGSYSIRWAANNLPSGVYFYRLMAGEFVQTHKMVYLR